MEWFNRKFTFIELRGIRTSETTTAEFKLDCKIVQGIFAWEPDGFQVVRGGFCSVPLLSLLKWFEKGSALVGESVCR